MKVVLVHDWLTGLRGGEKCLETLCRRFPQADLFTLLHHRGTTTSAIERMRITTSFLQHAPGDYRWWLPLMPRAIESLTIPADTDLVVSFSHAVAKGVRVPPGIPHVSYCFTPMRYAWQLREDYVPAAPRGGIGSLLTRGAAAAKNRLLNGLRHWDRATSPRVTHFVAASQTVAGRIAECYGRASRVIYPPVDTDYFTPADVPREDYYLVLSALVPYKRIELAIAACRALGRRLVIIGRGPERQWLEQMSGPGIEFLGWEPADVIRDHLRRAKALLFPGHEDFGIVPVEAQACGTPVIAFRRGGATETVLEANGDRPGTGVFFDEQTPDSLAAAIRRLEDRPRQCCPQLARRQAERFHADRFESELLDYLNDVAGGTFASKKLSRKPLARPV